MRTRLALLLVGALVVGIALTLVRGEARVWGDTGVFLSVGARLVDGDRLYADVADNKDPFFYYSYALALWAGGVRAPAALDALWLALSTLGIALLLYRLRLAPAAVVAGALVYPLALTAVWYEPGASALPGLALAPWAAWLWLSGRFAGFGAVLGISILFKANLPLVVAAPAAAFLACSLPESPLRPLARVGRAAAGLGVTLGAAALILAIRGELRAYLTILEYNSYYSSEGLRTMGGTPGVVGHLELVREFFLASGKWHWPAVIAATIAFAALVIVGWRRFGSRFRQASLLAVTTMVATIVTLALTALFNSHLQMLAYPFALLAAAVVVAGVALDRRLGAIACISLVAFAAWSTLKHEDFGNLPLESWTSEPISTPGTTLQAARERWFAEVEGVSYAVFSRNSEDGHAAYIDSMSLECRWFHQYPFYRESQLRENLDCARQREPLLILVTHSFYDPMEEPRWQRYAAGAQQLLAERYELVSEVGMSQVWKLR
jgi:hypothetical protein